MGINNMDKTNKNLRIDGFNEAKIIVDTRKLSQGLKTTFEGIATVFGSLGADSEIEEIIKTIELGFVQEAVKMKQSALPYPFHLLHLVALIMTSLKLSKM